MLFVPITDGGLTFCSFDAVTGNKHPQAVTGSSVEPLSHAETNARQ